MSLKSRMRKIQRQVLARIDEVRLRRAQALAQGGDHGSLVILPVPMSLSRHLWLPPAANDGVDRSVSCLMVTRGRLETLEGALAGYEMQDHADRELVIVTGRDRADEVRRYVQGRGPRVRVHAADPSASLGDLRNLSVSLAAGDIVCQWDDDDLHRPDRIRMMVAALIRSGRAAAMLRRVTVWWPERRLIATSSPRNWEGTMAAWRHGLPVYPALARGEDTPVMKALEAAGGIAQLDRPDLYVYRVTGLNTWDVSHFEKILRRATDIRSDEDYAASEASLIARHPEAGTMLIAAQ